MAALALRQEGGLAKPGQRIRRSYKQIFLDALRKLSHGEQKLISNDALRQELNWDAGFYGRIKGELVRENSIIVGRGKGGTVGLADAPGASAKNSLKLFISYSHVDENIKEELVKHLIPLKRLKLIEEWHDRKIGPGDKWSDSISTALDAADIIILIVSIDFINSKYCFDIELERALERHTLNQVVVVPVIARSCMWKSMPFAPFQALPTDGKAIANWHDRDDALTVVAEGIRVLAERLLASQP